MTETADWQPSAAYLYVLQLDAPGIAWEFLRRNPAYGACRHPHEATQWGLSFPGEPCA